MIAPYYPEYAHPLSATPRKNLLSAVEMAADASVRLLEAHAHHFSEHPFRSKDSSNILIESLLNTAQSHLSNCLSPSSSQLEMSRLNAIVEIKKQSLDEKMSSRRVAEIIKQIFFQWNAESLVAGGAAVNRGSFGFTQQDLINADIKNQDLIKNQVLMCHHFAFYKLNEQWAKQLIFAGLEAQWPKELHDDACGFFSEKGYTLTNTPVEGDLVVYCDQSTNICTPQHYGIWTKTGKVLGKVGNQDVYEHDLNEVTHTIGDVVYFLHKAIKSSLQTDFLNTISTFSQAMQFSPLTLKGTGELMLGTFLDLPMHSFYLNSLYNLDYCEELRYLMSEKLHLAIATTYFESKADMLDEMRQITLSISADIKPRF